MTGELSQHKVEKSERIHDFVFVSFYNKDGEEFTKQKLAFSYIKFDDIIEFVECETPFSWIISRAESYKLDVKIAIEDETGMQIYGEINFVKS